MNPASSSVDGNESTGRRQGHHREAVSLSADRQAKEAEVQSYERTCKEGDVGAGGEKSRLPD